LPATEFNKKALFEGLAVFYVILALLWTAVALRWWRQLLTIQKALTAIVWLCVVESVAGWAMLATWNSSGSLSQPLLLVSTIACAWKADGLFEMLLFPPHKGALLEVSVLAHLALFAFMLAVFNIKVVLLFRDLLNFQRMHVVLNAMPAVLMFVVLFVWVQMTLCTTIEELRAQKNENLVAMYQKLRIAACVGLAGAGFCSALQIFDPTMDEKLWGYHVLASEGMFQILYALFLAACMILCLPSQDRQGYEYVPTRLEGEAIGAPNSIWDDDDCEDAAPNGAAKKSSGDLMSVE